MAEDNNSVLLVTAGYDHTIRFWEALSGICVKTFQHAESHINCVSISVDKRLLAVGGNPCIRLYETSSQKGTAVHVFEGHGGNITSVGFQRDCRWMYSGSEDNMIRIWDMRTFKCQRDYDNQSPVNCVALHPNQGELISCDQNGSIKIWDLAANACVHELIPEEDVPVRSVSISNDGSILVAANNKA